jgi:signal transduction histidine kinase
MEDGDKSKEQLIGELAELRQRLADLEKAQVERQQAAEELERGRGLIFSTLEVLPASVCLLAPDYHLPFANRLFRETFGDPEGKACYEVLHDRSSPCKECLPLGVLESGEPLTREWTNPLGRYFMVHYHPFEDEYGTKLVLEMGIDITERKRMEEALEMINRELEAYAQVVSHDLRGPISVIQGAGFTLDELMEGCQNYEIVDQAREITGLIKKSSMSAEALIESLLGLAEAGQVPNKITEVDVKKTVEAIFEEKSAIIEEKGVRVVMAEDLGLVMAEPTHIYQIFSNLIANALKYNDNPEPELRISYYMEKDGTHLYLVSDNGPGIRMEDMERIFEPLFKGKGGGTGIGLAIARKIAAIYGGKIKAYNDGGACFEFTIKDLRPKR